MGLSDVIAAELAKLRTLRAAVLTAAGTVLAGPLVGAALTGSARADVSAVDVATRTVPYVQSGLILLGLLPAGHEYAGRQITTSLVAVPDRGLLLIAKAIATMAWAAGISTATIAASLGAGAALASTWGDPRLLAGAVAYLTAIALLAHGIALLTRAVLPALVGSLGMLLLVSPVLGSITAHARWLPDRAGAVLYRPDTDSVLTPATGALVLAVWVSAAMAAGCRALLRHDA